MSNATNNVFRQKVKIQKKDRQVQKANKSFVIWFTGLSGSGKSSLANELEFLLYKRNLSTYLLDGDNIRLGLNKDLGFNSQDRMENIRRIAEVSKLFVDAGVISIAAFISPYIAERNLARSMLEVGEFIEIYVKCPITVCEIRDPKGLYKKARSGEIKEFTGISAPYEEPISPEIIIETHKVSISNAAEQIVQYLLVNKLINN
ncbi:adenylyl-sulfate kinase [Paenibacillus sp. HWE-109]|uniref:adenylyl-sulfate kinase n=1 Tax=Paenibacillus sp. HWE-109 TaxID=1306526 RepID=UPI001EDE607C|nr:adenylyl-sulfate kinase [Paenibacillus sp. HWE-109]UKS24973.1 adenylyl-sulfate kinase [Paenibacillus sp. HWE-109]